VFNAVHIATPQEPPIATMADPSVSSPAAFLTVPPAPLSAANWSLLINKVQAGELPSSMLASSPSGRCSDHGQGLALCARGCRTSIAQTTSRRSPSQPAHAVRALRRSPCDSCATRRASTGFSGTGAGDGTSGKGRPSGRRNRRAPSGPRATW